MPHPRLIKPPEATARRLGPGKAAKIKMPRAAAPRAGCTAERWGCTAGAWWCTADLSGCTADAAGFTADGSGCTADAALVTADHPQYTADRASCTADGRAAVAPCSQCVGRFPRGGAEERQMLAGGYSPSEGPPLPLRGNLLTAATPLATNVGRRLRCSRRNNLSARQSRQCTRDTFARCRPDRPAEAAEVLRTASAVRGAEGKPGAVRPRYGVYEMKCLAPMTAQIRWPR